MNNDLATKEDVQKVADRVENLSGNVKTLETKIDETVNNMTRHFEQQMFVLETELERKLDIIIDKLDDNDRKITDINKEDKLQNNILDNHECRILDLEVKK